MYDVIIIGSGPAGVTAGIYAVRREMKVLLIGKPDGGQIALAGEIENFPGITSISSIGLITKFQDHLKSAGVETRNAEVNKIEKTAAGTFIVYTTHESFETKTIIVAMGLTPRRLALPGEERLSGRGISYCANCDGPLYKNKVVGVIGGGNAALDAAEVLSKIASKVYLIHRSEHFKAFDELVDEVNNRPNIEVLLNCETKEIIGETKLEKIKLQNIQDGSLKEIELNGLFVEIGRIAHTDLVGGLVKRDERNQVIVDDRCATSMEGVFAAGDVTQVEYKQITVAMGQGTIAALAAYQYLQLKQGNKVQTVLDRSIRKKT